jgi:hypothetical protein
MTIENEIVEINDDDEEEKSLTYMVSTLPDLCQYIIYNFLHEMYMTDLRREIMYNVVWVRLRSGNNYRYQFLTSTQQNYVVWSDDEDDPNDH